MVVSTGCVFWEDPSRNNPTVDSDFLSRLKTPSRRWCETYCCVCPIDCRCYRWYMCNYLWYVCLYSQVLLIVYSVATCGCAYSPCLRSQLPKRTHGFQYQWGHVEHNIPLFWKLRPISMYCTVFHLSKTKNPLSLEPGKKSSYFPLYNRNPYRLLVYFDLHITGSSFIPNKSPKQP